MSLEVTGGRPWDGSCAEDHTVGHGTDDGATCAAANKIIVVAEDGGDVVISFSRPTANEGVNGTSCCVGAMLPGVSTIIAARATAQVNDRQDDENKGDDVITLLWSPRYVNPG